MRILLITSVAAAALVPTAAFAEDSPPASAGTAPDYKGEIIVTASPFAHAADSTPSITEKVDSDDILKSGGANIADALSKVPGVSGSGFAAGASRPIIRGMDASRVRILENGTSMSDVSDVGPDHGVPFDPLAARSIEVVRGAGTLRYGSQAIGGVVNALNDRVPTSLKPEPFSGEVTGSYGTVDDSWQGSALADASLGNFALHADAFVRDTGDYDTPLGKQANSFFRGHGEALGGSYFFDGGDSHVGAAIEQYNSKYGIPADESYIDMKQTKVVTRDSFALGTGLLKTLTFDGSYADYQHSEILSDTGEIATTFLNKEYDGRAELLLNPLGFVQNSAVGFEYMHRDFSAVGEDSSYLFPTTTESEAGYLFFDIQPAQRLHLELSGRVEHVSDSGTPKSDVFTQRDFTPVSGAIGALFEVSNAVKIGATFSSTGRAPAITELFARGGHDGPGTYETGDPDLSMERANSLEGTLRIRSGGFRFDGSIYSSWFHNYIYGDLTGRTCDEDGNCVNDDSLDFRELFYRQQGAHFRGVEGQASYDIMAAAKGTLELSALADYTRATLSDGSNVPRIPPYRVGGGIDWQSDAFDAGVSLTYSGRQDKAGAFDTPTDGFTSLGAQVSWRPFEKNRGIQFSVIGSNLTDSIQRNAAAFNKDDVVMPGRSVRFVVKLAV
ncbi:MAG: TonB-dependent receptor [Novosphingobium sp.]|nr:TonB-dependent receptor [Novosphingobium sp.]